jgi:hypothetical protein
MKRDFHPMVMIGSVKGINQGFSNSLTINSLLIYSLIFYFKKESVSCRYLNIVACLVLMNLRCCSFQGNRILKNAPNARAKRSVSSCPPEAVGPRGLPGVPVDSRRHPAGQAAAEASNPPPRDGR